MQAQSRATRLSFRFAPAAAQDYFAAGGGSRINTSRKEPRKAKEGLAAAQETLRLSQERKEFGIAAVLEHILAEQDLTRARNDYVTAGADYDKAGYALLRATGARPESGQEPR